MSGTKRKNNWNDPLAVPTLELAAVLQRWVDEFDGENEEMPYEVLSEGLNLNERVFKRILELQTVYTTLSLADEVLQFIERPDAIHNKEVHVCPNPYWNQERWIEWYLEERRGC